MVVDLYTPLALQLSRVRGCGITRGLVLVKGTEAKPDFQIILRADSGLWGRIMAAPEFAYPDDVVDIMRVMVEPIMQFVTSGDVHLLPSEPVVIALATKDELAAAHVTNANGMYTVPNAMLEDEETQTRMAFGGSPGAIWSATLNSLEFYDPHNPRHKTGISFVVVANDSASVADCVRAIQISDPGWNWVRMLAPGNLERLAIELHEDLPLAEPLSI